MKKIIFSLFLVIIGSSSFSAVWTVSNVGTKFSPETITISYGDSVKFELDGDHNAVEVTSSTWNANGSTQLSGGFSVAYGGGMAFPSKLTVGTHYYVCTPHAGLGMKGKIIVQSALGIDDKSVRRDISISPNPSNGIFKVEPNSFFQEKSFDLMLYNIIGRMVYTKTDLTSLNQFRIDVSDLPKGTYILKLNGNGELFTRKIIIR